MSKIIKAVFTGRFCTTRRVFQYDTDDKMQIVNLDLPQNYTVDFANSLTGASVSVLATSDTVQIPADMFVPGSEIYAWVWISDTNGGHTKCQATIPIDLRAQRSGTSPTPAQASAWDEAVGTLNETVEGIPTAINSALAEAKASGEFDGADGQDGADGNQIWWTNGPIAPPSPSIVVDVSNLSGGKGSPKAGDYVIGPVADVTSTEPSKLYSISIVAFGTAVLTEIGSIKGAPGQNGQDGADGQDGATGATGPEGPGVSDDLRAALVQFAAKVAYIDDQGQTYYNDLYNALYNPPNVAYITAVFNQGTTKVYSDTPLDNLKPMVTVFGFYDNNTWQVLTNYTLTGTLVVGTSAVTVTALGKTTTFDVLVTGLNSITAVYTQSGAVYDIDTLDSLKADLVVTANYSDSSTQTVPAADYTLSGTLTAGTSTITVAYGGKTTTFNVTVTEVLSGYTTVGNPSIDSSYRMTTSDGNFIKTPFEFDNNGEPWELRGVLYVSRSSHPEATGNYFDAVNMVDSSNASTRGLLVEMNNGKVGTTFQQKFNAFISSEAGSWDIFSPAPTFSFSIAAFYDSDMFFKVGWTGTTYYLAVSTDGQTWSDTYRREVESSVNILTGYALAFGNKRNLPWGDGIYINSLAIDIDGAPYWRAVKGA